MREAASEGVAFLGAGAMLTMFEPLQDSKPTLTFGSEGGIFILKNEAMNRSRKSMKIWFASQSAKYITRSR
jgi:hypothetical protein